MFHTSALSSSDGLSCILKLGRELNVSYYVFPSRISDNCEEQREHNLHPGMIEISKDNKSSALLLGIVTFPRDSLNIV